MGEWKKVRLGDVIEIIGGGTPKTSVNEYWNGNIPWLSVVDFGGDRKFVYKTDKSITENGLNNSSTKILKKGQIIISARGTVGEMAVLGKDMAFNQSCYGITSKNVTTDSYLYYLLKFHINNLKSISHGSVFDTITRETFYQIEVDLPPLPTQTRIASILSAFDDKIELNRQMNHTLEQMAQALFKKYFVDFEFPNKFGKPYFSSGGEMIVTELGEIPKIFERKCVYDLAIFINGAAYKNMYFSTAKDALPVVKIVELKNGITESTKFTNTNLGEKYRIENGDILFSWSGSPETSIDTFLWVHGSAWLNQHIFKVETKSIEMRTYFYFLLKHLNPIFIDIASNKQTTGLGHVTIADLKALKVAFPTQSILLTFSSIVTPILDLIQINLEQNNNITVIRDSLLPKLMSGEINVEQIPATA